MNKIPEKQQTLSCSVHIVVLAILAVLLAFIYANSFQAPFTFDDLHNIVERTSMQMTTMTSKSLHRAMFEGVNSRRWLPNLSFGLNYYFGGHGVWGYHLLNLAVHIMTAMVLYGLFFTTLTLPRLGFSPRRAAEISLISAVIWAVHPIQTNAVTYLVQRMTSMAAFFYLASLLFYVRGRLRGRFKIKRYFFWAVSLAFGLLALASKENSAVLPLIILAYECYFLRDREGPITSRGIFTLFGFPLLGVFIISWFYVGQTFLLSVLNGYGNRDFTLVERLLTETRIVFHYLSLLVLPLPSRLNLAYDYVVSRSLFLPSVTIVAMLGIICLVWLTIYLFRRNRLLSFGLLWFLSNLIIESSILPLELIFEHRLYLPSSMLILAVVVVIYELWGVRQQTLRLLSTAVIIVLCVFTWQRNVVWSSEVTLWQDVVAKSPNLSRAYANLGRAYNMEERYQETFDLFQKVSGQKFGNANVYNNWGQAAFELGKLERAVELFEHAVWLNSGHPESHYNLGLAYGSQGRKTEARREMLLGMSLQ